jgi:eukaryotic-like serine/threonine-protein kinase
MCLNSGDILHEKYRIIAPLGCGGFARTYTAEQINNPDRPQCVVKEIPFPRSSDPRVLEMARRRFDREARALRRLGKNSRIPELFDSFEASDCFYLVQEYIPGHQLRAELAPGQQWTQNQTIDFLAEVLEILQSVHQEDIVHRDITPANLIRRETDRQLVLIDFGAVKEICTFTSNSTGEILTSQAIGTAGYMPAEQYNCRSTPQPYNDIYAVGIIAIQGLTGRPPTNLPPDPETGEILWNFLTSDRVSDGLSNILNTMVRFHFPQRYQSAAEVLQALDVLKLPTPRTNRSHWLVQFRWLLLGTLGIAVALAIVLLIPRISRQLKSPKMV